MEIKNGAKENEYFIINDGDIILSYLKFKDDKDIYIGVGGTSLNENVFSMIIEFLKENVLEKDSYINVVDNTLIALFDKKYQAKEIYLNKKTAEKVDENILKENNILIDNVNVKYYDTPFSAYCNFAKQNISNNKIIKNVDDEFKNKCFVDLIILPENLEFVKTLGYEVWNTKFSVF